MHFVMLLAPVGIIKRYEILISVQVTALTKVVVEKFIEMFNDGVKLKVFEMRGYMTKVTKICIYFVFILRRQNLKAIP